MSELPDPDRPAPGRAATLTLLLRRVFGGWTITVGVALVLVGFVAVVYAHYHNPTVPGVDPEAVHLLSRSSYEWLHQGGLDMAAAGGILIVWSIVVLVWASNLERHEA